MRTYTTKQGDMWDSIAHTQLGDASHVDRLMRFNTAYLNYYIFPTGIVLTLPDIKEKRSGELPPWKQVNG